MGLKLFNFHFYFIWTIVKSGVTSNQMQHLQHAVGRGDDFLSWLSYMAATTNYVKLNPSVSATTHYRMDGGKLSIDPVLMDEFLKHYAGALDRGEQLSIVERRTDVYKMHFDVDALNPQPWTEADILWVLQEIRLAMAECFCPEKAAELFRTVVLVAPPKQVGTMWKTGVHVIYPDLEVDSAQGLTLRKVSVMRLNKVRRRIEPLNSWDDVLDKCVHTANGLRMVGSVKMAKCLQCAAKRKKMKNVGFDKFVLCDECCGKTMCNEGRPYTPLLLLDASGNKDIAGTEALLQNHYMCVKLSSIRCFNPVGLCKNADFALPPGIALEDPGAVKGTKGAALVVSRKFFRNKDKKQMVAGNQQLPALLEEFITSSPLMVQMGWTCAENPYRNVSVIKVSYTKVNFLVHVEGPGSSYCNNKNGLHNSSKVYFEFRSKHLVQRCFCGKAPANEGVSCKEFKSRPVKLPEDLRRLLFPPVTSTTVVLSTDELRQNVSQNMKDCAVAVKLPDKRKEKLVVLQRYSQQYAKRLDFLNHLAVTSPLDPVPLTKDVMYPSAVSSQLCTLRSEDVDLFSAAELCSMTEEVVLDLMTNSEHAAAASKKPSRKRKRADEDE